MHTDAPFPFDAFGAGWWSAGPVSVVLADDDEAFRLELAHAIGAEADLRLLAQARDGADALALIEELEPDVAVLSDRLPGLDGIDVCATLVSRPDAPPTAVLLLSAFEDDERLDDALCCGAAGHLGRTEGPPVITAAIRALGRGEQVLGEDAAAALERDARRGARGRTGRRRGPARSAAGG